MLLSVVEAHGTEHACVTWTMTLGSQSCRSSNQGMGSEASCSWRDVMRVVFYGEASRPRASEQEVPALPCRTRSDGVEAAIGKVDNGQ